MARDRTAFLPLLSAPYDACDKRPGRVSSLSLVRYKGSDYSVPVGGPQARTAPIPFRKSAKKFAGPSSLFRIDGNRKGAHDGK